MRYSERRTLTGCGSASIPRMLVLARCTNRSAFERKGSPAAVHSSMARIETSSSWRFCEMSGAAKIVADAIRKRALLQFSYKGRLRVVAPYCLGVSTRGVEVLRAIQVRGSSASGGMGFGKLWDVSEMVDLRILA